MITGNVKKMMDEKGMTIRGLVAALGLADRTILRARGGHIVGCRLYTLQTIAEHLGCAVKGLFTEEPESRT